MSWRWLEDDAFQAAFHGIAEDDVEAEMDKRTARIDEIAARIKSIQRENEQAGWLLQARFEDGYDDRDDYDPCEDMDEDEAKTYLERDALNKKIKAAQEDVEMDVLEEELARLGARIARPYEHWNEDEKLMEYMERDR